MSSGVVITILPPARLCQHENSSCPLVFRVRSSMCSRLCDLDVAVFVPSHGRKATTRTSPFEIGSA